jgi:hypothetical protein
VKEAGSLFFPSLSKPGAQSFYHRLYTGNSKFNPPSFFPDVTVVADNQVAPIHNAVAGRTYTVLLEGFSGPGDVVVQLVQGTRSVGQTVATVPAGFDKGQVTKVRGVRCAVGAVVLCCAVLCGACAGHLSWGGVMRGLKLHGSYIHIYIHNINPGGVHGPPATGGGRPAGRRRDARIYPRCVHHDPRPLCAVRGLHDRVERVKHGGCWGWKDRAGRG